MFLTGGGSYRCRSGKNGNARFIVYISTSQLHKLFSVLNFVVLIVHELFLMYQLFQVFREPDQSSTLYSILKLAYFILCYSLPIIFRIQAFIHYRDIPMFLNQYVQFSDAIQSRE